jgi:hypothetical protein
MTPKEKAEELVYKYYKITKEFEFIKGQGLVPYYRNAKKCSIIAVKELIQFLPSKEYDSDPTTIFDVEYWYEVKKEIELL